MTHCLRKGHIHVGRPNAWRRQLSAASFLLQVKPSYTIKQVKLMLEEKGEAPANWMRLIFARKQLECYRALSDYNIMKESTLHMVGRSDNHRCGCVR